MVKNLLNTLHIISCHNKDCNRHSDAGDHIACDFSHAISMELPLDSCPDIHGFITAFFFRALCETLILILAIACCQNQLKRRLNAITITSATCFLFPAAMWDFINVSYRSEIFCPVFNFTVSSFGNYFFV